MQQKRCFPLSRFICGSFDRSGECPNAFPIREIAVSTFPARGKICRGLAAEGDVAPLTSNQSAWSVNLHTMLATGCQRTIFERTAGEPLAEISGIARKTLWT
jgi:hypothetical protein